MGFLKELYEVREVVGPSGITYGVKRLNAQDFAAAMGLIPTLLPSDGKVVVSDAAKNAAQAAAVASVGIVWAKLGEQIEDGPISPDLIPALDAIRLSNAVLDAELQGTEAEQLRRVLPGTNGSEKPGRTRSKVRGDSVGSHA